MTSNTQKRLLRLATVLTRYVGIGGLLLQLGFWMATRDSNAGLVTAFVTLTGASVGADLLRDLKEEVTPGEDLKQPGPPSAEES